MDTHSTTEDDIMPGDVEEFLNLMGEPDESPYAWILVQFKDGTNLSLSKESLLFHLAHSLARDGRASPSAYMEDQLRPAVAEDPKVLLEMVKSLSFEELRVASERAFWQTPAILVKHWWPRQASFQLLAADDNL